MLITHLRELTTDSDPEMQPHHPSCLWPKLDPSQLGDVAGLPGIGCLHGAFIPQLCLKVVPRPRWRVHLPLLTLAGHCILPCLGSTGPR